jgi:uncharacterized protein
MSDEPSPLNTFTGVVRLFPLPNLVLFPGVMQPLHVFEPRYRQMTRDALAGDRLIALVLLRPGWEADYDARPAVHPVACVGKIVADQALEDGRFNLLVRGLGRVQIVQEVDNGKPYRSARVDLLPDVVVQAADRERELRRQLIKQVPAWFPGQGPLVQQFHKLLKGDHSLSALCDIVAFALPLSVEVKQELLAEVQVERRARRLLRHLRKATPGKEAAAAEDPKFPPEFSLN